MTNKRFTLTYEKIGKYFNMGIVDHETKQPFDDTSYEFHQCSFQDSKDEMEDLTQLLNELHEENMNLRAKNTEFVIILKDVVNDLKRMDTYRYAEHLEKIANIRFLSEKELNVDD